MKGLVRVAHGRSYGVIEVLGCVFGLEGLF